MSKPKKPTEPYGHIAFSKDGRVRKIMRQLPSEKEKQEHQVAETFVEALAKQYPEFGKVSITDLAEADHDQLLETPDRNIHLQITEIVEREYAFEISREEYNSGKYSSFIARSDYPIPYAVDVEKRNMLLVKKIEHKLNKHYAKGRNETLWLLIFNTSPYLQTIFSSGGKLMADIAYKNAVSFVSNQSDNPFDEIWYTNLLTRPVRIWPPENLD